MPRMLSRRSVVRGSCALAAVALRGTGRVSAQEVAPTPDPTVTALERDKLRWEVAKLEEETASLRSQNDPPLLDWLRNNAIVIAGLVGGGVTVYRWWVDRDEEREKRAEDRLTAVMDRLGSTDDFTRINAAHHLLTFLQTDSDRFHLPFLQTDANRFYTRILYLVVAHLRLQPNPKPEGAPLPAFTQALVPVFKEAYQKVRNSARPGPVWQKVGPSDPSRTRLVVRPTQALVTVFKEKSPNVRNTAQPGSGWWREEGSPPDSSRTLLVVRQGSPLDMSNIQLPGARLVETDLSGVWMHTANLSEAHLNGTDLTAADLSVANLTGAYLGEAILSKADLNGADLTGADATKAILTGADLREAHLTGAILTAADLTAVDLRGVDLTKATLTRAILTEADLREAILTDEQRQMAVAQGAILDDPEASD